MRILLALSIVLSGLLASTLNGQAGLPRQSVGPGQGPQTNYLDSEWEYWWYLNQEPLLALRKTELRAFRKDTRAVFEPLTEDGRRQAIGALLKELDESDPEFRSAVLMALARSQDGSAVEPLGKALEDGAFEVRRTAALALGILGDPAAVGLLYRTVRDTRQEDDVRFNAGVALGLIEYPAATDNVAKESDAVEEEAPEIEPKRLTLPAGDVRAIAWHPDGTKLIAATADGNVWILEDGTVRSLFEVDATPTAAAWSTAGDSLALATEEGMVHIYSARSLRVQQRLQVKQPVTALSWDPERGERIAVAVKDGTARVYLARTGKQISRHKGHEGPVTSVAWQPQEERVASGSFDGTVRIWFARSGKEVSRTELSGRTITATAWRPDGSLLALATADGSLALWDGQRDSLPTPLPGKRRAITTLDWTPDGSLLAVGGEDNTIHVVPVEEVTATFALTGHVGAVRHATWSPDGTTLATCDDDGARLYVIDTATADDALPDAGADTTELFTTLLQPEVYGDLGSRAQAGVALGAGLARRPELSEPIRALLERRKQPGAITRSQLVLALGKSGDMSNQDVLFDLVRDKDIHARRSACIALGNLFFKTVDPQALERLARQLGREDDNGAQQFQLVALGLIGGTGIRQVYSWLVDTGGTLTHNGIAIAPRIHLGAFTGAPFSALSIGLARDPYGFELLLRLFRRERVHETRAAFAIALGLYGDRRASKAISAVLDDERDPILRGYLALALGMMGESRSIEDLHRLLMEENDIELLPNVARALVLLGDRDSLDLLLQRLKKENNTSTRRALLYCLGKFGDRSSLIPLVATLHDEKEPAFVRRYAAVALGDLLDEKPFRRLALLYRDYNYMAQPTLFNSLLSIP